MGADTSTEAVAAPELIVVATRILEAAAAARWRGSDPYDGLWWSWPKLLVGGRRRRQAMMQLHARSPVDIRVMYAKERPPIPKALGIFGSTALKLHQITADRRLTQLAADALDTLSADEVAGTSAWGYHWDMQTRWSFYPAGSPNVVVTAFAVDALERGAAELGEQRFSLRAQRAAEWVLDALWRPDLRAFVYHPGSHSIIHNANLLGALTAWRVLEHDSELTDRVGAAVERTLAGQRADGSWPYGTDSNLGFVDSFHTGYVLRCLCELSDAHPGADEAIALGAHYYTDRFFDRAGTARLWPGRAFPEDGHSAGTALTTLAVLQRRGDTGIGLLERVARRALDRMVIGDHAVFRRYRWGHSQVHFLRWCDAHMALGMADAAALLSGA
jgi:hypothetical protein